MDNIFQKYSMEVDESDIHEELNRIIEKAKDYKTIDIMKKCFQSIDITSLNATDTPSKIRELTEKVNNFSDNFPDIPNVSAICVYPSLASIVRQTLTIDNVKIAAVAGGFPTAQTFIDVKIADCMLSKLHGADELDVVISLNHFLDGDYENVFNEIDRMNRSIDDAYLKVILETGAIKDYNKIRLASLLAMEAGAKIIKTSTGKFEPAATPDAFLVMAKAVKDYHKATRRVVGLKAAGGIVTTDDALLYYSIIKNTLGEAWLSPEYFRIGASRLTNNLLSDITGISINYF